MDSKKFSTPMDLRQIRVSDEFWHREQELVRTEVIPYQWDALNDRIPDAEPSYSIRNFKAASIAKLDMKTKGSSYASPRFTFRGWQMLPEDPAHLEEEKFYGFLFQDSDFWKWIEAVGYSLAQHPDAELEKTADAVIDTVCEAQLDNGYWDTYYIVNGIDRAFTNLRDHHELYCMGHLVEGAVAYYQATGKDKLLKAAMRYADHCAEVFGPEEGQRKGYPGHEEAELALVRLYGVTGNEKYLKLSKFFLEKRGTTPSYFRAEEEENARYEGRPYTPATERPPRNWFERNPFWNLQAHKPVREQEEAVGHAVRAVYLYSGMADVARLTQDETMLAACERLWDSIAKQKLYITGGIGGTHMAEAFSYPYDLPNDTAYSETCAAIGLVFFARRMLQIRADRKYGDVMEQALYNTVLSGMALDGKSFFYVNPLEVLPLACDRDERKFHVKPVRQKWFGCACCPPNIARLVSSVSTYAYTQSEDTLYTHLYMGSELSKQVGSQTLDVKVESALPWEGNARMNLHADNVPCKLAFRIPGWSKETKVIWTCNGEKYSITCGKEAFQGKVPADKASYKDGYLYLSGDWQDDTVEIDFDLSVRVVAASKQVREDIGKVAVTRGPITYCLEEADNGPDLHLCRIDGKALAKHPPRVEYTEALGHRMATVIIPGKRILPDETDELYLDYAPAREEDAELRFVPYYAWNNRGAGEMTVWVHC